jgi:hypothetical protein
MWAQRPKMPPSNNHESCDIKPHHTSESPWRCITAQTTGPSSSISVDPSRTRDCSRFQVMLLIPEPHFNIQSSQGTSRTLEGSSPPRHSGGWNLTSKLQIMEISGFDYCSTKLKGNKYYQKLWFIFSILGIELRALHLLGKWSTTWTTHPTHFSLVIFQILSHTFAQSQSPTVILLPPPPT